MKISVVMTSYNSSKYIREQLDSIFPELDENDELIISDDCSVDDTVNIIKSYNDARIRLFENPKNIGANANFENALTKVTGDIVVVSDSDNVWLKGKIKRVLPFFEKKNISMVMHDSIITNERLEPIIGSYYRWRKSKTGLLRNIIHNGYGGSMMSFRSSFLKYILPFPRKMEFFFDEWIGMMCEKYGKCLFIDDKLSYWRRHDGTVSSINVIFRTTEPNRINNTFLFRVRSFINILKNKIKKLWLVVIR